MALSIFVAFAATLTYFIYRLWSNETVSTQQTNQLQIKSINKNISSLKEINEDEWIPINLQKSKKSTEPDADTTFLDDLKTMSYDMWKKKYMIFGITEQVIYNDRWSHKTTKEIVSDPKEIQLIHDWLDIQFWKSKLLAEGKTKPLLEMLNNSLGLSLTKLLITSEDVKDKLEAEMSTITTFEQFTTTYSNTLFEYNILDPNDVNLLTLVKDFITKNPNNDQSKCWKIIKQYHLDMKSSKLNK